MKVKRKNKPVMQNKKNNSEIKRILKSNMSKMKFDESSEIPFVKNFLFSLLKEQEEKELALPSNTGEETGETATTKTPDDFTPEQNQKDLENSLEPNTDPSQFDIEGISPELTVENIDKVLKWSKKLDEFALFLNSPTEDSLHKILADNDRAGSLLRGVTRKASDSITRITGEIEKLKAVLDTYINTAPKKLRDTEQIRLGS
jgi:hypothetical protein